jgi:hypothetical protein
MKMMNELPPTLKGALYETIAEGVALRIAEEAMAEIFLGIAHSIVLRKHGREVAAEWLEMAAQAARADFEASRRNLN